MKWIVLLVFLGVIVFSLMSCNPLQKSLRFANSEPKEFAGFCAEHFPCVPLTPPDTIIRSDSSKYVSTIRLLANYIDDSRAYYEDLLARRDTSICDTSVLLKTIADMDATIIYLRNQIKHIPAVHDSIPKPYRVEDSAKIEIVIKQRDLLMVTNKDAIGQREKFHEGRDWWRKVALILAGIIGLNLIWKLWLKKYFLAFKF